MDNKAKLLKFIDAVIADDVEQEKLIFAQYTETKTQEVLGLTPAEETTTESANVQTDLRFEGDSVYHKDKKVGSISYDGKDEFNPDALVYTGNGERGVKFKNTDELMQHLKTKHGDKV
jgi:hypothetical protein